MRRGRSGLFWAKLGFGAAGSGDSTDGLVRAVARRAAGVAGCGDRRRGGAGPLAAEAWRRWARREGGVGLDCCSCCHGLAVDLRMRRAGFGAGALCGMEKGRSRWSCCFIRAMGSMYARLMAEDAGAVEEEPGEGEADDDGDVDGLAEAGAGTLVVERVEQVDDLMLLQFAVAAGAQLEGLACPFRCLVCGRGLPSSPGSGLGRETVWGRALRMGIGEDWRDVFSNRYSLCACTSFGVLSPLVDVVQLGRGDRGMLGGLAVLQEP